MNQRWSLEWNTRWWITLRNSASPGQLLSSSLDANLPYLFSCTIRSGYRNCCGKLQQEAVLVTAPESFLLKAITVFPNRCAVGQAQVCCRPLSHSLLRTEVVLWKYLALLPHLFFPPRLHCQRRHLSQTYSPHPVRCSFRNPGWFFFNSFHSSRILKLMRHVSYLVLVLRYCLSIS